MDDYDEKKVRNEISKIGYESNSYNNRAKDSKPEPIAKGEIVEKRQKRKSQKVLESFISEDLDHIKDHVMKTVIKPTAKKLIIDVVCDIFGESKSYTSDRLDRVSFRDYTAPSKRNNYSRERERREEIPYDEIAYSSKGKAEKVLDELWNHARRYDGFVPISFLYDISGVSTSNFTYNKYGWTLDDLRYARTKRLSDGRYSLVLPMARPID